MYIYNLIITPIYIISLYISLFIKKVLQVLQNSSSPYAARAAGVTKTVTVCYLGLFLSLNR